MPLALLQSQANSLLCCLLVLSAACQAFSGTSEAFISEYAGDPSKACAGPTHVFFNGRTAPLPSAQVCGLSVIGGPSGPQIAVMEQARTCTIDMRENEDVRLSAPVKHIAGLLSISFKATLVRGSNVELALTLAGKEPHYIRLNRGAIQLDLNQHVKAQDSSIVLLTRATGNEVAVRWTQIQCSLNGRSLGSLLQFKDAVTDQIPPPVSPSLRPGLEQALIEWDWRMQDGIGTQRAPSAWEAAVDRTVLSGNRLLRDLTQGGVDLKDLQHEWSNCLARRDMLAQRDKGHDKASWEILWRDVHMLRRRIALQNPLMDTGPIVFIKRVPSDFSHQLTQYAGLHARPGGGVYSLKEPGRSMKCQNLTPTLPSGSYLRADVSHDGQRVLFAFCRTDTQAEKPSTYKAKNYHIYEMNRDGSKLTQLTRGSFDDFSPQYLPDDRIVFLSTRRGGFHRCGRGPCHVHTLATMDGDGSGIRVISFHETHEWDPCMLLDGRIIYTRWDYVDRHAVHYQQLWTACPDGSNSRIFYGNNTLNPVGVWEPRPVPNSKLVMATAGAHHAMTAGSIILLDTSKGVDDLAPITRLTPDVLFPESESAVFQWHAPVGVTVQPPLPIEQERWPGHCYRSPYPLSDTYFLAAYSFDSLIGEPRPNRANMFGLYLVDAFGNKELLYRDLNIGSLWPVPLHARVRPARVASILDQTRSEEGTFFLQNVYESWPGLPAGREDRIKELRILQVLPKSTPHANDPRVGHANASPGKQVLGTVPVEADGSAYFCAPAGISLSFQALDGRGQAVQIMRSLTYLQPGENASCIGCHEHRSTAPASHSHAMALKRTPSRIAPGPDGSKPFSYPILVQPVLNQHCVNCHSGPKAAKGIVLTGDPAGAFTASYNSLAPFVSYSEWEGGNFRRSNSEPLTRPGFFGARASRLTSLLANGHEEVKLTHREMERLVTWMDTNALFYGTFNKQDQLRQRRGERISGPDLE
jgi:hypothetical protein